jgi:hypothetical protein
VTLFSASDPTISLGLSCGLTNDDSTILEQRATEKGTRRVEQTSPWNRCVGQAFQPDALASAESRFVKETEMSATSCQLGLSGLACRLLMGLAAACVTANALLAGDEPKKTLPPSVARVLQWLPEDTETLFVARSVELPDQDRLLRPDWESIAVGLACGELLIPPVREYEGFELRLIPSANDVSEIPTGCKAQVIIAAIDRVLHFRVFDDEGKQIADLAETRLPQHARVVEDLKTQLAIFWPPHRLESGEVRSVNIAVAAIVGEAQLKPLRDRKIQCVVSGARNFEGVSKMGSLRSENCSMIVFERDLGDASAEWTASLRKGAQSVRRLAGREVFVFPSGVPGRTRFDRMGYFGGRQESCNVWAAITVTPNANEIQYIHPVLATSKNSRKPIFREL